jgi:hypothetical protein
MRHTRFENLGIGAVFDRQRDEGGPHVVVSSVPPAERR